MRRLDLHSLQIFASVVAHGSLSGAAHEMHMTPSAVSKRMTELESRLGTSLLERSSEGVAPTPAGSLVALHCEHILERVSAMMGEVAALSPDTQGQVSVMSNTTAILLGLLEDIGRFRRAHPGIRVLVTEGNSHDVVCAVKNHAADIGVCVKVDETEGLAYQHYRQTALAVVLPKGHPLAAERALTLDDLQQDHIVWTPPVGRLASTGSDITHGSGPDVDLLVRSFDVVLRSVNEGAGLAVIPEIAIMTGLPTGLASIPLQLNPGDFEMIVCHDTVALPNVGARQLLAWLCECGNADYAVQSAVHLSSGNRPTSHTGLNAVPGSAGH